MSKDERYLTFTEQNMKTGFQTLELDPPLDHSRRLPNERIITQVKSVEE